MNSGSSVPEVLVAFPNWFLARCNDRIWEMEEAGED